MRVGSQISMFLAPLSGMILVFSWMSVRISPGYNTETGFVPYTYGAKVALQEHVRRQPVITKLRVMQNLRIAADEFAVD